MPEIYNPHKELSLYWRGRLVFQQYIIKSKRHKYGIKFFKLYVDDGLVLNIFWNKIHRYWTAWADKIYYFAPHGTLPKQRLPFVHWLLVQLCITHRTMLKGNTYYWHPACWSKAKPITGSWKEGSKGWMVFMSLGNLSVTKWKDKSDACVISNARVPTMMDSVNRQACQI